MEQDQRQYHEGIRLLKNELGFDRIVVLCWRGAKINEGEGSHQISVKEGHASKYTMYSIEFNTRIYDFEPSKLFDVEGSLPVPYNYSTRPPECRVTFQKCSRETGA